MLLISENGFLSSEVQEFEETFQTNFITSSSVLICILKYTFPHPADMHKILVCMNVLDSSTVQNIYDFGKIRYSQVHSVVKRITFPCHLIMLLFRLK